MHTSYALHGHVRNSDQELRHTRLWKQICLSSSIVVICQMPPPPSAWPLQARQLTMRFMFPSLAHSLARCHNRASSRLAGAAVISMCGEWQAVVGIVIYWSSGRADSWRLCDCAPGGTITNRNCLTSRHSTLICVILQTRPFVHCL